MKVILFVALESEFPKIEHANLSIHYTGVGKVNSAIKSTQILSKEQNALVLNYGSAGTNSLNVNEIYKCTSFTQFDIDARPLVEIKGKTPYDNIIYPEIPDIISFGNDGKTCCTADFFQQNPSCEIVDMEAYSIAKVCKIHNLNFISYKFISDDGNSDDWLNNHVNGKDLFIDILNEFINK